MLPRICLFAWFSSLQIGYERHWLHFLKEFIVPVNARLYPGYNSEVRINTTRYPWIFVEYLKIVSLSILLRGLVARYFGVSLQRFLANLLLINSFNNKCHTLKGKSRISFGILRFLWVTTWRCCRWQAGVNSIIGNASSPVLRFSGNGIRQNFLQSFLVVFNLFSIVLFRS